MSEPKDDVGAGLNPGGFPKTQWSLLAAIETADEAARRTALNALAEAYWKPIYAFIRASSGLPDEKARELTQDFFVWILETDFFARADRDRGRFRSFVKAALRNYVVDDLRYERRVLRGGRTMKVALDNAEWFADVNNNLDGGKDPQALLDQVWRDELVRRATSILAKYYQEQGKPEQFELFRDYCFAGEANVDRAVTAAKYGVRPVDVSNFIDRAKKRFRGIVRRLVAETVQGAQEIDEEMKELFGGGGP